MAFEACPKCKSPNVSEWDCYCLTGCASCGFNRHCQDCNHLYREKTEADLKHLQKQREMSRAAQARRKG